MRSPSTFVVLVAAGQGLRLANKMPKAYVAIGGHCLLEHTVRALLQAEDIQPSQLQLVISDAHQTLFDGLTNLPADLLPPVIGGLTRGQSVQKGLAALPLQSRDKVLIHDAARPFVSSRLIDDLIGALDHHDAAMPTIPIPDALKQSTDLTHAVREDYCLAQTPQAFRFAALLAAQQNIPEHDFPDEAAWVQAAGLAVSAITGEAQNFKITYPQDFTRARQILCETVYGSGFDLHRYDDVCAETVEIAVAGVLLPHHRRVIGHSDGDVVLHALVDALLGTIAAGDIGQHFPPNDSQWKGVNSKLFLDFALQKLHDAGAELCHADVTIIADTPKISPHWAALQASLCELLSLPKAHVGVKATTSESLGFMDVRHGIAAQVLVSVTRPKDLQAKAGTS